MNRVTLIKDLASFYESSNGTSSSRFEESLITSFKWLFFLRDIDPRLSAVVSTVEHIRNIPHDRTIGDVQIQIEARIDEELSYRYERAKQNFICIIVFLSEIDINEINEMAFVNKNVHPFKEDEFIAYMWNGIDKLKKMELKE